MQNQASQFCYRRDKSHKINSLAVAIALACSGSVFAQEEASAPNADGGKKDFFEQIIVTGTASGTAVRKVDSSYATTSLDADMNKKIGAKEYRRFV